MPSDADPRTQLLSDLADPTRFGILELLERGPMTATALAHELDVSTTQLANHLRRLRDAGLVGVQRESRLAIYHLAEPGLREIFSMLNGLRGTPTRRPHPTSPAITCYDHLAGPLGVAFYDHLVTRGALLPRDGEGEVQLGPDAEATLDPLGLTATAPAARRMVAYACLDSRLRRPHLGGALGADLRRVLSERGWILQMPDTRELALTDGGRRGLAELQIEIEPSTPGTSLR